MSVWISFGFGQLAWRMRPRRGDGAQQMTSNAVRIGDGGKDPLELRPDVMRRERRTAPREIFRVGRVRQPKRWKRQRADERRQNRNRRGPLREKPPHRMLFLL